uniref:glucuronosyltransferase n=1 Tax=Meloidogyne floridensis TaxID=298350 RepID=A0A915P8S7_9BILA
MIFESGTPYELWWTGREFKEMRLEACEQMLGEGRAKLLSSVKYQKFDLAIGHFHDFCPVAMARSVGVSRIIWITHGPSLYDFTSLSLGLQTFPSFVPHPLSFNSDRMNFLQRLINVIWHYSGIEFVNLPNVLLHEENSLYKKFFPKSKNLWSVGQQVSVLLLNGERFLDFPRPLPTFILNLGSLASKQQKLNKLILDPEIEYIYSKKESKGWLRALFSGTVSNTTNMPLRMTKSFLNAFGRIPEYDFLWKTEQTEIEGIGGFKNVHLQHPKTRLLFAHGGYSSFLEAAKAGIPILLVPLFADQGINAKRAQRFGICEILDKKTLNEKIVEELLRKMLSDNRYHRNARKLSAMLADNPPSSLSMPSLEYGLRLAVSSKPDYFSLKSAKKLGFLEYFNTDIPFKRSKRSQKVYKKAEREYRIREKIPEELTEYNKQLEYALKLANNISSEVGEVLLINEEKELPGQLQDHHREWTINGDIEIENEPEILKGNNDGIKILKNNFFELNKTELHCLLSLVNKLAKIQKSSVNFRIEATGLNKEIKELLNNSSTNYLELAKAEIKLTNSDKDVSSSMNIYGIITGGDKQKIFYGISAVS